MYALPGNFYRIRSAFKYGAHKLGQLLLRPKNEIADEILNFFSNTRAMHERHQHSSHTRHLLLEFSDQESLSASLSSPVEFLSDDGIPLKSSVSDFDYDSVELDRFSVREVSPETASEACDSVDGSFVSGHSIIEGKCLLSHSNSSTENGSSEDQQIDLADSERFGFNLWLKNREEHVELNNKYLSCLDNPGVVCNCTTGSSSTLKAHISENLSFDYGELDTASVGGESEASNPLADLTGDYHSNIRSLLSAQLCHGFALSAAPMVLSRPSSPLRIQNKKPRDIICRSISLKENEFSQKDTNVMSTNHITWANSDSALFSNAFHFQGTQKPRGIGTYFPNMVLFCSILLLSLSIFSSILIAIISCRVLTWRGLCIGGVEITILIRTIIMASIVENQILLKMKLCLHEEDFLDEGDRMYSANLLVRLEVGIK